MRLIDADALKSHYAWWGDTEERRTFDAIVDAQPAADVAPVRRGTWVHDGLDNPHGVDWMHCSMCGSREPYVPAAMTKFCPHCGAQMDGGEDDKQA